MHSFLKQFTRILGVILVLLGIIGFFSGSMLLGIFQVNAVQNSLYLVSGIVGLLAASSSESLARVFLILFGLLYALVAILGFVMPDGNILALFTVNAADNYLHAGIAIASLGIGFGGKKE